MIEPKVRLSVILPGSVMFTPEVCESNPKEMTDCHRMVLEQQIKQGKKKVKTVVRDVINFTTRKCKPAKQVVNINKEAYNYYVSVTGIPEIASLSHKYNRYTWQRLSKAERLRVHLNLIAESLGGAVDSYEIFED